ncbi:MAG TPA: AAA family ATPase [Terracidiphilus sp.]|jgi:ABC-type lipoprotein export system ATPase subunit
MIWNSRGSIWHRWDPHIHAPGTLLSDQFGGDWEAYLSAIETAYPPIRGLGITDYLTIETYKQVRKRKLQDGRLKETFCLFPNVEFRLDVKTAAKAINVHLLFSPDDPQHEYEIERILGKLRFEFQDRIYACTPTELIQLGRAFDRKQTDDLGALRTGAQQFKISFSDLQRVFKEDRKWLSNNCLVAVAGSMNDGTAALKDDDAFVALRREIERFADIIFAATPNQRDFWLGKMPNMNRSFIEERYGTLKPCMHGSDAHRVDRVGKPDLERYCWLKGDLSFETLRQAIIEPEDRVWIGSLPPVGPSPSETIGSMRVSDAPWLGTSNLRLNPGLIAIIGARGSGKTALMELLATGANALSATTSQSSFFGRAGKLLDDASVALSWADGATGSAVPLCGDGRWDPEEPSNVSYLSQQFVERLCSASGLATELRKEMERVVFEATAHVDRMECESFNELAEISLHSNRRRREEFEESIGSIGESILKEELSRDQIPALTKNIEATKKQIEASQKEMQALLPKQKDAHAKRLEFLEGLVNGVEGKIQGLRVQRRAMSDLAADVKLTRENREPARFEEMQNEYVASGLSEDDWKAFAMVFRGDVNGIINRALTGIDKSITTFLEGDPLNPLDSAQVSPELLPLNSLKALRDKARQEVGIDTESQKKYDGLQRKITELEGVLKRTEEAKKLAEGAEARRAELVKRRRQQYVEVFESLAEQEQILGALYAPLRKRLEDSDGALGKLAFVVTREVNLKSWAARGEKLIDLRYDSAFRGRGAVEKQATARLLEPWQKGTPEEVAEAMENFRRDLYGEIRKSLPEVQDAVERHRLLQEVATWLHDTSHITMEYGITYEGVTIERLSPGTRGIVLLLLYVAIDIHDRRPLFIDQPEENLDPRSVYKELVPHFREAKRRRQIVVVTHNANLVVNTDADQVIVATSERTADKPLPTMTYDSGSIENPDIRKLICRLLEGGQRAFREREKRYRIAFDEPDLDT